MWANLVSNNRHPRYTHSQLFPAIQFARLSGFSPIITPASPHNAPLAQSLGATHVIDRSSPNVVSDIQKVLAGRQPKLVYDSVSDASTQPAAWEVTPPGGVLALVLPALIDGAKDPSKCIHNMLGNVHTPQLRKLGVSLYSKLTQLLQEGKIVVSHPALPNTQDGGSDSSLSSPTMWRWCLED